MNKLPSADRLVAYALAKLLEPLQSLDTKNLTDEQKFAIAIAAGAKIADSHYENGKMTFTTEPCAVVHDGHGYRVFTRSPKRV